MAEIIFNYEGNDIPIQCNINDKLKKIIVSFLTKCDIKENNENLFYLYNGTRINNELTFNEQANDLDKRRKKMNIVVSKNDEDQNKKREIISYDIICPQCKENALINIKNFKIDFKGCKNNHDQLSILLNKYGHAQQIDLSKIICDLCHKKNKGNTHNNLFYICNTCNKNICPLCQSIHDKNHIIINYDDKNYICRKHNDSFTKYCESCNENLCIICENKHKNHKTYDFRDIIIDKDDLLKIKKDLKKAIDKFKMKINIMKEMFNIMMNILERYYKLNEDIINNYNITKRNYYKLQSLNNLKIIMKN